MEAAGVALAVLATTDLCLKYGNKLVEACKTFKNADSVMQENALRVEARWFRVRTQMNYVREAHEDFDHEFLNLLSRMFDILEMKLKALNRNFDKVHDKQLKVKKWKVVTNKEFLDKAIAELGGWQELFDPSWAVVLKILKLNPTTRKQVNPAPLDDDDERTVNELRHARSASQKGVPPVFFEDDRLAFANKAPILHSSTQLAREPNNGKSYITELLVCPPESNVNTTTKNVRNIASKLQTIDPIQFGILQCKGVIRKKYEGTTTSFEFVFRLPPGAQDNPKSFRSLINATVDHSLTERLKIAQQLARAVCYVHTLDFVHKNIRPESIIVLNQEGGSPLGSIFLIGFQRFRAAEGQTHFQQQSSWDVDLYRHPDRQGEHPEQAYVMQHDIYSLGVCLLEIGLWSSFVTYTADDNVSMPGSILDASEDAFRKPKDVKDKLERLASNVLPSMMGDKYADVVVDCLTCLDPSNLYFADNTQFEDADGILIGVKYIEKILLELESIVL